MQTITMNYKGFCFNANPAYIKAEYSKNIASKTVLFKSSKQQEISFKAAKIKGKGKFVGTDAGEKAHELIKVFRSKGSAFLFSPDLPPMTAYFSALDISYNAVENCVDYSFEFIEDSNAKNPVRNFGYTFALDGENLYDIANRTSVGVDKLFKCNNYPDLFSVSKGDKVWLC